MGKLINVHCIESPGLCLFSLPRDSTRGLKAEPGKLDIKRHSPSIRYFSGERSIPVGPLALFYFFR